MSTTTSLSRPSVLAVAVAAEVDPRTVLAYLADMPQRPSTRRVVEQALRERGHASLVRVRATAAA